jgi:hypothetical protein
MKAVSITEANTDLHRLSAGAEAGYFTWWDLTAGDEQNL